jgi:hypothetical protein
VYTGLKPAGLEVGAIIALAVTATGNGHVEDVYRLHSADLHTEPHGEHSGG